MNRSHARCLGVLLCWLSLLSTRAMADAPDQLDCAPAAGAPGIAMTWNNQGDYQEIRVYVDGVLTDTLPGTAGSYLVTGLSAGPHDLCIEAVEVTGLIQPWLCCSVGGIGEIPTDLTCVPEADTGGVVVSWMNADTYSSFEIVVDGTTVATLPGTAESYLVLGLTPGLHTICVFVYKNGLFLGDICCEVEVVADVSPADLTCVVDAAQNVVLNWSNPFSYVQIRVTVDGSLYTVLPGTATTVTVSGLGVGVHTICLIAETAAAVLPAVCCTVDLGGVIGEPPIDLTCGTSPFTGGIVVAWTNMDTYSAIDIVVDGATVATLPGSAMAYTVLGLAPGAHTICVLAYKNGSPLAAVCCDIEVGAPLPPLDLSCTVISGSDVTLVWTNPAAYTQIRVTVDGTLVTVLPGTATTTTIVGLAPGVHTICLVAETAGAVLAPVCCTVDLGGTIGEPPIDLTCGTSPLTGGIVVSWTNMDTYSSIDLVVDGATVATLPGSATVYTVLGLVPGTHTICVLAYKNGSPLDDVCCTFSIDAAGGFDRGDANADGSFDIGDPVATLDFVFGGADDPSCEDAMDSNDDGQINIADVIYSLSALFSDGPPPPAPHGTCDVDPTVDGLTCADYPCP